MAPPRLVPPRPHPSPAHKPYPAPLGPAPACLGQWREGAAGGGDSVARAGDGWRSAAPGGPARARSTLPAPEPGRRVGVGSGDRGVGVGQPGPSEAGPRDPATLGGRGQRAPGVRMQRLELEGESKRARDRHRQTDGRTGRQVDRQADGWTERQIDGWTDRQTNRQRQIDRRMDRRTDGQTSV